MLDVKHIPTSYLRGSERQRRALLAGLLDSDGTVSAGGCPRFTTTSQRLLDDVTDLVAGLGFRFGVSRRAARSATAPPRTPTRSLSTSDEPVFRLTRKAQLHKERAGRRFRRRDSRFIVDVRPVASVPVRCVEVDNEEHLYLAGPAMIPTHNSTLGIDIARAAAIKHRWPRAVFSLEMSRTEITMRILSAEATIQLQDLRKGLKGEDDWTKLARIMGKISEARCSSTTARTCR